MSLWVLAIVFAAQVWSLLLMWSIDYWLTVKQPRPRSSFYYYSQILLSISDKGDSLSEPFPPHEL